MLSDIEIAQNAKMKKIQIIAEELGISSDELEPYGHYKAKLSESLYSKLTFKNDGKCFKFYIKISYVCQHQRL